MWKGRVIGQSEDTVIVEGNHYFPSAAANTICLPPSGTRTICPRKGEARYYDVVMDGDVDRDAAWYYPHPKPVAQDIAGRVDFWRAVDMVDG